MGKSPGPWSGLRHSGPRLTPLASDLAYGRLIARIAATQVENILGRVALAFGRRSPSAAAIDLSTLRAPDSALARQAEEACQEQPDALAPPQRRTCVDLLLGSRRRAGPSGAGGGHDLRPPTPGINVQSDGSLGCYVQWGAMVDGAGLRLWDISRANQEMVLGAHPRGASFKREPAQLVKGEADAVPEGRFALLVRFGLPPAVRLAPYRN
jgi:hypothetical protein